MTQPLSPGSQSNFPYAAVATQVQARQMAAVLASVDQMQRNSVLLDSPSVLLQAVIIPGDKTSEGQLIQAVALPWFEIIAFITCSPEAIYAIHWRKWEEIIAAAYKQQGFDVVLTPRSNDKGRDVIDRCGMKRASSGSFMIPGANDDVVVTRPLELQPTPWIAVAFPSRLARHG